MKGLILGAGFTGMAAAIKTGFPIYEASDHAGGICTSYMKEGFQFSHGGPHFLFGKGPGLDYIKSLVPVTEHARRAGVYYNCTFPYPFQTSAEKPIVFRNESLKEWLYEKFGHAQCNLFFNPFNEKYTAGLYDQVVQADDFKSPPAGSVGFISTFGDPVGGLSTLVDKMSAKCQVNYKKRAIGINPSTRAVFFDDGEVLECAKIISTIPLDQALKLCGHPLSDRLPYTSVLVLNIGAEPDVNTPTEHWLYVPFCKTGFHRLCFYSNVDAAKAPAGKVGLAVEIAFPSTTEIGQLDVPMILDNVIQELQSWRFIGKVITTDPTWVKCAYTWLYSKEDRDAGINWLRSKGIISTGRYGKWAFQGMVDSVKDGFEVDV